MGNIKGETITDEQMRVLHISRYEELKLKIEEKEKELKENCVF